MNPVFATDETLGNFLSRSAAQRIGIGVPVLDKGASFSRTDVIELCGPAGTGKTEFLYAVAMSHVLQASNRHVVYIDLDYKFEPYRVSYLLQHRLQADQRHRDPNLNPLQQKEHVDRLRKNSNVEDERRQLMENVRKAFERLHVFSCSNSLQFLATLKVLATEFVPSLYERGGTLGVIVVDNISAYWDVLQEIKSSHTGPINASKSKNGRNEHLQFSVIDAIVHSLTELRNMCDLPVLISRRIAREEYYDAGNRQWNDFVVKRASVGCRVPCRGGHRPKGEGGVEKSGDQDATGGKYGSQAHAKVQPTDISQPERTIRWVKGEEGSTTFEIHPIHGIL